MTGGWGVLFLFLIRHMEDFVTWVDTSKLKRTIMRYNDEVRISNLFVVVFCFFCVCWFRCGSFCYYSWTILIYCRGSYTGIPPSSSPPFHYKTGVPPTRTLQEEISQHTVLVSGVEGRTTTRKKRPVLLYLSHLFAGLTSRGAERGEKGILKISVTCYTGPLPFFVFLFDLF